MTLYNENDITTADAQVVMAVATSDAKAAMTEKYEQRINDLGAMTPTELYKEAISSETARKFHRLKKQFQEDAAVIMKHIGENPREYAKAQAWIDAAVFPEDGAKYIEILQECIRPADTPKAGYERTESLAARLQPLFEQNSILRHALIVDKETGKKTLSGKRALSWLRKYADIGTMHTKEGSVVIVHSLTPIFAWFEEKTGKPLTPEDAPAFFEYRERARMSKGDTSDHNVSYRRKVSPLQPADPSQANISFERKQTDTSDHNVSYRRKVSPVSDAAAMQEMESAALTPFSEVSTVYEQSDIYHPFCELCQQHKTNPNCRACKF